MLNKDIKVLAKEENEQEDDQKDASRGADAQHVRLHAQKHTGMPAEIFLMQRVLEIVPDKTLVSINNRNRKQREYRYGKKEQPEAHLTS
jgi:hypothetical protein